LSVRITFEALAESDCVRRRFPCGAEEPSVGDSVPELRELDDDMAVFMEPTAEDEIESASPRRKGGGS
jgi:hypothetical protein